MITLDRSYFSNFDDVDDYNDEQDIESTVDLEAIESIRDELKHYGVARRSGRYPWGSGEETYQRTGDFLARIEDLKKKGMSEVDISNNFGLSTTAYRTQRSLAKDERRLELHDTAKAMHDRGLSLNQIAKNMGFNNDSSVRSLLNETSSQRMNEAKNVAALLKKHIDEKGMIDVGAGVETALGVSKEKLKQAKHILEMEGYVELGGRVEQVTNAGKQTTINVMAKPGTERKEVYDTTKIHTIHDYNTKTGDANADPIFAYPKSLDGKRVGIRYAEDGGVSKDGTIELRRGVDDLSLGNSHYSQVRILVDNKSYLKGMAVYKDNDNFPPGVDVMFNTNKSKGTPPEKVFKSIEDNLKKDPTNPFGSAIKEKGGQSYYIDKKTGKRELSAVNKRADEGDWDDWSAGLPSQFLAKQPKQLITKQLNLAKSDKLAEYDEIMSITNPTVKRHYLQSFADDCDSSAKHLKAASLPRQKYQVILPIDTLKDNEIYAPNFKPGETVALVRFPHGGTFEIPTLKVNNKNPEAIKMLGKNPKDAVCINSKIAERLSGADFDGDTVLVLPSSGKNKITSKNSLDALVRFDNKKEYPAREGMRVMKKENVGIEMGKISNLITDMTLKGANNDELARAVKHSMVVIDAHKHGLDYKKSEDNNGIAALKKRYQTTVDEDGKVKTGGASTILSRAKSEERVEKRIGSPKVNQKGKPYYDPTKPEGALLYNKYKNEKGKKDYDPTKPEGAYLDRKPETYVDSKGKTQIRTEKTTKMDNASDARKLMSGGLKGPSEPQEELYADYANYMKSLANSARKSLVTTGNLKYSPEAKKNYDPEVKRLKAGLNTALMNAPRERQAQLIANSKVKAQQQANPDMTSEELKKIKQRALSSARIQVGAKRESIIISDREWDAIQAGAITDNVLSRIIQNTDADSLRDKATPRSKKDVRPAQVNRLKAMQASGYTNEEIAAALNLSVSTIIKYL